jgi:predicted DNA-binding transcriptional regulator YafY
MNGNNQLFRFRILDQLLRRDPPPTLDELVRACNHSTDIQRQTDTRYSKRTIRADLQKMREKFNAPIPKRNTDFYQYTDLTFSIFQHNLMKAEIDLLLQLSRFLAQFQQFDFSSDLQELLQQAAPMEEMPHQTLIDLGLSTPYAGTTWLSSLYQHIAARTPLQVVYQPFSGPVLTIQRFEAYLLKFYNRRWYILGHSAERPHQITNLAVERIQRLQPITGSYQIPEGFAETHFSDIIGTTHLADADVSQIIIEVKKPYAHYLHTAPLHPSQRCMAETENSKTFSFQLRINHELQNTLLSMGSNLMQVQPENLRQRLYDVAQQMTVQLEAGTVSGKG